MPSVARKYEYWATTQYKLFAQIASDPNIKSFGPYGLYKNSRRKEVKPIIFELLKKLTGGDYLSFINDILTPLDVAEHISPASEVCNFAAERTSISFHLHRS